MLEISHLLSSKIFLMYADQSDFGHVEMFSSRQWTRARAHGRIALWEQGGIARWTAMFHCSEKMRKSTNFVNVIWIY